LIALAFLAWAGIAPAQAGAPKPVIERAAKGDRCVEDTAFMRRNHMELLKHHRDETVHLGIRTRKYSLKGCIDCHASKETGSVAAAKDDFCVSCHAYAAVKIDCFDCHSTKPQGAAQATARLDGARKRLADATRALGMKDIVGVAR
jgi:hypothetical protein